MNTSSIQESGRDVKPCTRLEWALWMAEKGMGVFAVEANGKRPIEGFSWYAKQTTDPDRIREMFAESPDINYGVFPYTDYVVVDLDVKPDKNGVKEFEAICADNGVENWFLELDTLVIKTASGGYHLYFKAPFPCGLANNFPGGIDVRGVNGFVVGPGCKTSSGEYALFNETEIAELPIWLTEYMKRPGEKDPNREDPLVELDLQKNVDHAVEWLKEEEAAVADGTGEPHTLEVILMLRDFGLSEAKILEVLNTSGWNDRCEPPWGDAELEKKIENAFRYGQNRAGCKSPTYRADEIARVQKSMDAYSNLSAAQKSQLERDGTLTVDNVTYRRELYPQALIDEVPNNSHLATEARRRFRLRSEAEQDDRPPPVWLIQGLIQEETLALIYGPQDSFKSFIAVDIALSAAAGRPWASFGGKEKAGGFMPVRPLTVVYVAGEGAAGVETLRRPAWRKARGIPDDQRLQFYTVDMMPSFGAAGDAEELVEEIELAGIEPDIIVIDTVARGMQGLEENSVKDTGTFVAGLDMLKRRFRCSILAVHHTGKDASKKSRGSTNIPASFDAHFEVKADKGQLLAYVKNEKQKDGEPIERTLVFQGEQVEIERKGQPVETLVFNCKPGLTAQATKDDERRREVREALEAIGGREKLVQTNWLASRIVRSKLEADPALAEKARNDPFAEDRMTRSESRALQRERSGLLADFLADGKDGANLSWTIPSDGEDAD